MEKYKLQTVIDRQWKARKRDWEDVETVTQEEVNNFFDSEQFKTFIAKNGNLPLTINPGISYDTAYQIFSGKGNKPLTHLAYKNFV